MSSRRLSAIMFTDIYGYSGLMSENEEKALSLLHDHDRILRRVIDQFKGKIIKKMGDAVFASFNSSLDAFMCSEEIHKSLLDYNKDKAEEERIIVRIGLHAGDVVDEDNDLYGDGVNIAARLEPLADPGGTCLSEPVYLSLRTVIKIKAEKFSDVELKNINERITIYKTPSVYGKEFMDSVSIKNPNQPAIQFQIESIRDLPLARFGFWDSLFISFLVFLVFEALLLGIPSLFTGYLLLNPFSFMPYSWPVFIVYNIIMIGAITIILWMKSVKIIFSDIRNVDRVLHIIMDHLGFRKGGEDNGYTIFKPNTYHRLFWMSRKIKVLPDGNSLVVNGSYMSVRKLVSIIKAYENK